MSFGLRVTGIESAQNSLHTFAESANDLRPFWPRFAKGLADTAQARWPLRRKTGRLRQSLTWRGNRLGRFGIYEPDPDRLRFGSAVFYGRFFQYGTKRQRARELIHVAPDAPGAQLDVWLRERATAAGLEVT